MKKACTLQKCARTAPPVPPFSCKQIRSNKRKQEETRQPHLPPDLRQVRLNVREREGERNGENKVARPLCSPVQNARIRPHHVSLPVLSVDVDLARKK